MPRKESFKQKQEREKKELQKHVARDQMEVLKKTRSHYVNWAREAQRKANIFSDEEKMYNNEVKRVKSSQKRIAYQRQADAAKRKKEEQLGYVKTFEAKVAEYDRDIAKQQAILDS